MILIRVAIVGLPVPGRRTLGAVGLALALMAMIALRAVSTPATTVDPVDARSLLQSVPLYFVESGGRFNPQVEFIVQGSDTTLYLTPRRNHLPAPWTAVAGGERP